ETLHYQHENTGGTEKYPYTAHKANTKAKTGDKEPYGQLKKSDNPKRKQLADNKLVAFDGCNIKLLYRADFPFAYNIHARQKHPDHRHQYDQNAGHHILDIVQVGIVPIGRNYFEA